MFTKGTQDMSRPHIFVINMKHSTERRAVMTARLEALGLAYSFFEAVDGRGLDLDRLPAYDGTRRRLFFGRDMTPGEIGCLLSHKAVYQHMVDQNIAAAVVLEDDVFLTPDFPVVIEALTRLSVKWDVIRFLAQEKVQKTPCRIIYELDCKPYALARIGATPGGAYGYMLTRSAAGKLLRHMQKNLLPVDILHGYVWKTGLESFILKPSPVSADMEGESTIGYGKRFDKSLALKGWERLAYPFTRSWLKFSELVGKRAAYWVAWPRDRLLKSR